MSSSGTNGDILSQALFQTGLSTPVKVEPDDGGLFFSMPGENEFLTSGIQDMVGGLTSYSSRPGISHQQNALPVVNSSVDMVGTGLYSSSGGAPTQNYLVTTANDSMGSSQEQCHGNTTISTPMVPVKQEAVPVSSDGGGYPSNCSNIKTEPFNDFDMDLGDLLSIPTPDIAGEPSTITPSIPPAHPSNFAMTSQVQHQVPFPAPASSTSLEFQPSPVVDTVPDLPVLDDIFGILGDNEPNFLMESDSSDLRMNTLHAAPMVPQQQNSSSFFKGTSSGSSGPMFSGSSHGHVNPGPFLSNNNMSSMSLAGTVQQPRPLINCRGSFVPQLSKRPSINRPVFRGSPVRPPISNPETKQEAEGDSDDEDDEDYGLADTYANYVPSKLKLGLFHPDSVVESSSLSSVDPPDVYFDLKLPREVIEEGKLSSLQLESVVYACQQHMNILADGTRAGFLVGDGAGVGKGRTIAGIIYQNYLEGRKKALWLSVSNDLRLDAMRDLKDVGAKKIDVHALNKFHYGKISGKRNGRVRKGVIFATYSSLIGESSSGGKYRTRLSQLLHWLGTSFEGVIVFDECHKAKNLVPTGASRPSKTGMTVLQLQKKLPKARIVYCSATGASEPKNMAYMSRLGIWGKGTQFDSFQSFIKAVEKRGVGAMEIVAIDMKLRGMYMARQLSFSGVTFAINEVELSDKFKESYDASVKLWSETRRLFQQAADVMDFDKKKLKTMWAQFWASHQRFFKYMCIAAKVPEAIRLTKRALAEGKCVVIGLQSTGEARTLEQLERSDGDLNGFVSTAKGVLETLIRRHFPVPAPEPGLAGIDWSLVDNDPTLPKNCKKKRRRITRKAGLMLLDRGEVGASSDSEDTSSGSPEKSDSAVESSSDDESSVGSGSSSSEEEDGDDDNVNPFGNDFAEPWLQRKKKVKRKRPRSPDGSSDGPKRKKNFSIKPPPHSSQKGKTKTGFNSKKLKFEPVQSPKPSPPLPIPSESPSPAPSFGSLANEINSGFTMARSLSYSPSTVGMVGPSLEGDALTGQKLTEAMTSRFGSRIPPTVTEDTYHRNKLVRDIKDDLLGRLELLSPHLPNNTLDELIDGLGGTQCVAEMTGRRGRVVSLPGGRIQYQLRSENDVTTEMLNIREKQRFMDGEKNIAIISEAASSGISLQADRRVKNRKRRVHLTLELPWSADKAIQQFGRTHRSNQVSSPEYIFLISTLSGEQRFASIVAKRLESLGALTHGDRRATESRDLSKFNVDTKYGRQALEATMKSVVGQEDPIIKMDDYPKDFFNSCSEGMVGVGLFIERSLGPPALDKDACTMSRFLNRILGLPVQLQNQLFSYFSDTLANVIQQARRSGRWDGGIQDFGSAGEQVEIIHTREYIGDMTHNTATTMLHTVQVERGLPFDEAQTKLETDLCLHEGFYKAKKERSNKLTIVLLKAADSTGKMFNVFRPNTGRQGRTDKLSSLMKKYELASAEEARKWWCAQYESSLDTCNHAYWQGKCRKTGPGQQCDNGLRRKTYHVLSGSLLGVWSHIESVFNRHSSHSRVQIVRVRTESKRFVGILVPKMCTTDMKETLSRIAQQAEGTQDNPITL